MIREVCAENDVAEERDHAEVEAVGDTKAGRSEERVDFLETGDDEAVEVDVDDVG